MREITRKFYRGPEALKKVISIHEIKFTLAHWHYVDFVDDHLVTPVLFF